MTATSSTAAERTIRVDDRPGAFGLPGGRSSQTRPGLKIYGERNTGTNYLEQLVRDHLDCRVHPGNLPRRMEQVTTVLSRWTGHHPLLQRPIEANRNFWFRRLHHHTLGWKHAEVPVLPPGVDTYPVGTRFVALVKNPYPWLLSLWRRPYQGRHHSFWAPVTFDEFLRSPWPAIGRENSEGLFPNPMAIWVTKVASYQRLHDHGPTAEVRYEDLLADPEAELRRIGRDLSLAPTFDRLRNVDRSTKKDGKSFDDYRHYYLGERWRAELTADQITFINEHLDADLVTRWGYELL